jgi:hypothetical protein
MVLPSLFAFINISATFCVLSQSRLPVGSSAIINSGSCINALAIFTFCFSQPLNCERVLSSIENKLNSLLILLYFASIVASHRPYIFKGYITFSLTDIDLINLES